MGQRQLPWGTGDVSNGNHSAAGKAAGTNLLDTRSPLHLL